jgi:MFS family permease
VLGMFGLVLVVGALVDRIGRAVSLWTGLVAMAVSCIGLQWFESVVGTGVLLFGLGLGWSVSFVAATAMLADSAAPSERGKLLGFSDQISALLGAALALLGGYALDTLGVAALAIGTAVIVLLPLARLLRRGPEVGTIAPRRT